MGRAEQWEVSRNERKVEQCGESRKRRTWKKGKPAALRGIGWNPKERGERGALKHRKPRRGTMEKGESPKVDYSGVYWE
jgi:hypothetical protein